MLVFRAGIHTKYSCQKSKHERPLQKQSDLGLPCLSLDIFGRQLVFKILEHLPYFFPLILHPVLKTVLVLNPLLHTHNVSILTLHAMQFFMLFVVIKITFCEKFFQEH